MQPELSALIRPFQRVVHALDGRPRLRRAALVLNLVVALVGAGLVAYPFATETWAERVVQPRLQSQLRRVDPASYRAGAVAVSSPVTRMRIPRLGVDTIIVEGVTVTALRAGAGHYPGTPLPGQRGNVAIAGHRTTYGSPFRHLDRLAPGDEIVFTTPVGAVTYRVSGDPFVVAPDDTRVVAPDSQSLLTLTTCHPLNSSRERLIVRAVLVGEVLA